VRVSGRRKKGCVTSGIAAAVRWVGLAADGSGGFENLVSGLADDLAERVVLHLETKHGTFEVSDALTKKLVLTSEAGGHAGVGATDVTEKCLGHEDFLRGNCVRPWGGWPERAAYKNLMIRPREQGRCASGMSGQLRLRGGGWHRGQKNEDRFMKLTRRTGVPQREHGRPSWP
jgi:hypothetical protein